MKKPDTVRVVPPDLKKSSKCANPVALFGQHWENEKKQLRPYVSIGNTEKESTEDT